MQRSPKRIRPTNGVVLLLVAMLASIVVYNIYDNHRFIVIEQEVTIDRLPPSFDGFRIVQVTDLHGRTFGTNQSDLIEVINSLDYDMVAFTGDMNSSDTIVDSAQSSKAILDLLDGLENKAHLYWIDGNTAPHAIESFQGANTGALTDIGMLLQEMGCKILTVPQAITRGDDRIWITPELSELRFFAVSGIENPWMVGGPDKSDALRSYHEKLYGLFKQLKGNGEVKIMLDHFPQQLDLPADAWESWGHLDYDLILAGHYHGGQWRLPLVGALYIPSPTSGINGSGWFPAQAKVKGLNDGYRIPQYVSAGLGASGHSRWTNFRLFNTPELNLIILRSQSTGLAQTDPQ